MNIFYAAAELSAILIIALTIFLIGDWIMTKVGRRVYGHSKGAE